MKRNEFVDAFFSNKGKNMHKIMCLCEGRHEMPSDCEGAIYENEIDPTDIRKLDRKAINKLLPLIGGSLDLYVTGLSVALVSVINACTKLHIDLKLLHFNRETGKYYSQKIYKEETK